MEFSWILVLLLVMAYLLGSIPTAVWMGKWLKDIDVREHGSGNAGATNAMRVLGPRIGLVVLLLDAIKGILAVALSFLALDHFASPLVFVVFQLALGAMAITGHVFPVFASFKGGKGIATLLGIILMLFPEAFLICLLVFLAIFLTTRFVSLGSISASIALPVAVIWITDDTMLPKILFALAVAVFVPVIHRKNISRLIKGKENRISFKR